MVELKKAWVYIKNYSWYILIIAASIAIILLTMGGKKEFIEDLFKKQKKSFEREMNAVKEAQEKKQKLQEENQKKYEDTISQIQEKYDAKEKELTSKDKKLVKEFIEKYNYSPTQAAKWIAKERGWEYVE